MALAWDELDRNPCPGCGQSAHESTDPANRLKYVAEIVRCHACTAKRAEEQAAQQENKQPGYYVIVNRKED